MHYLGGVWDVVCSAVVLMGVLLLARLVLSVIDRRRRLPTDRRRRVAVDRRRRVSIDRRRDSPPPPPDDGAGVKAASGLDRGREWELVVRRAAHDLARVSAVEELQANATVKIQSAELAYNRVVRDCAKLCDVAAAPTVEPTRALAREAAAPAPERAPLAA